MRKRSFIFLILICAFCKSNNNFYDSEIDNIVTDQDLINFIQKRFDKDLIPLIKPEHNYTIAKCNFLQDSIKIKHWFKSDINNDGRTDLIITDFNLEQMKFCILDQGNNKYSFLPFPINLSRECVFIRPIKKQSLNLLELFYLEDGISKVDKRLIIYKFDRFIEYNPNPKKEKVNYISFDNLNSTSVAMAFSVTITRNGEIDLKHYDNEGQLLSKKDTLNNKELKSLFEFADYTDFLSINYKPNPNSVEYPSNKLTFGYGKNKTKSIEIYKGLFEHFILDEIISYMFKMKIELADNY